MILPQRTVRAAPLDPCYTERMNPAAIATLLQLAASLLTGVRNDTHLSPAAAQQTIAVASRAIQFSAQAEAMSKINFPTVQNNGIWPNIADLYNAPYLGANGKYVPLAPAAGVSLIAEDTSFGDINGDGLDDAAAVVEMTDNNGSTTFALAAMLNQGGIMFNIADFPLGSAAQIYSHHIAPGGDIILNGQFGTASAQTSTYELFGDQLIKL